MSPHIAILATGLAALGALTPPATPSVLAQDFPAHPRGRASYQVTALYDRVTDSTRVMVSLPTRTRPFGLGSRVWLDAHFTFPGRRLLAAPEFVILTLESWTPSRGGWAFAHPAELRVVSKNGLRLEIAAAEYVKRPVHLFDSGRREALSFRIPVEAFVAMSEALGLSLRAGNARIRFDAQRMTPIRDLVRQMTPLERDAK
jgi:hypothetical protein